MINWKKQFPITRVALGLLGQEGWTSMLVARWLLQHEALISVRDFCKKVGRELSDDAVQSRLKRPGELEWIQKNNPDAYARGEKMSKNLAVQLKKAGFVKFERLG
jgi:hypothetical protein